MTTRHAPGLAPIQPGSSLNPIQYIRDEKIMRIRDTSITPRVTTFKGFGRCGVPMNIRHEYIGRDRAQEMQHGGLLKPIRVRQPKEEFFMVGDKFGVSLVWDECQWERIAANDQGFVQEVIEYFQEDTMLAFDSRVISSIMGEAHRENRGANAGHRSKSINLGSQAAPLLINSDSVWTMHYNGMQRVLNEHGAMSSKSGRPMYVLHGDGYLPYIKLNDRMSSFYHQGNCMSCNSITMGDVNNVDGVDYINARCLPSDINLATGDITYPLLFGYDDAIWAGYDVVIQHKEGGHGDDNKYIDMYWHFGLKVIDPRKLGVAWVKVPAMQIGA